MRFVIFVEIFTDYQIGKDEKLLSQEYARFFPFVEIFEMELRYDCHYYHIDEADESQGIDRICLKFHFVGSVDNPDVLLDYKNLLESSSSLMARINKVRVETSSRFL